MKRVQTLLTVQLTLQGRNLGYKWAAQYCYLSLECIEGELRQGDTVPQLQKISLVIDQDTCKFTTDLDEQAILRGPHFLAALPVA